MLYLLFDKVLPTPCRHKNTAGGTSIKNPCVIWTFFLKNAM